MKQKILHIDTDTQWRGGQQQAFYLYEGLTGMGYNSSFVCQPDSLLAKKILASGLDFIPMRIRGELDFIAGKKIAGICGKYGYNIVHLHDAHAMSTGIWASFFNRKLKLIGVRRVNYHIKKNFFSRYKYQSKRMTKIVAISQEIKRILTEDKIDPKKISLIKSGIDIKKYGNIKKSAFLIKKYNLPENAFVIGTVASLTADKDYPSLLQAAKKIICKHKNIYFFAVGGDGPEKDKIFKIRKELGLGERFIFTGFRTDVGNYLKNFDIFVLSSKTEGLGTSVMDAMAAGLPCVCCKSGGIPELIDDRIDGLLVEKQNPGLLAETILDLYDDEEYRKEIAFKALKKSPEFSIKKTIEKNIELYEKIIY